MRDSFVARMRSVVGGWLWVPVVLLVLPGCDRVFGLNRIDPPVLIQGPLPRTSLVFCDIEKMSAPRRCASAEDVGIALSHAAVALSTRDSQPIGLDYSEGARQALNCGSQPVVVTYEGRFPEGYPVCVKCLTVIGQGALYETVNAMCVAQCQDINLGKGDPAAVAQFCQDRARASTNSPQDDCFGGACTPAGNRRDEDDDPAFPLFIDPRRVPERVVWTDGQGVGANGNSLTRTAATTGALDAGAVSTQWITRGDAYVEFAASENNLTHVAGLSEVPANCAFPCTDQDPSIADIGFAISLNVDGRFYILESGSLIDGPGANGSWGNYAAGERFRVTVTDNNDASGTATIKYSRILGPCAPGTLCAEELIHTSWATGHYRLRVDTSFREINATLTDVRVVRIR